MARVTVEDCVAIIPNRFELVLLAAQRARDISAGHSLTVNRDNDKNPVVALREIAEQSIDMEELRRHIVKGVNRMTETNAEDELLASMLVEGLPVVAGMADEASAEIREISFDRNTPADFVDDFDTEDEEEETAARADVIDATEGEAGDFGADDFMKQVEGEDFFSADVGGEEDDRF